jgi:prepilin signal peptidase PulO-like enzyme (type II secretory pathway)
LGIEYVLVFGLLGLLFGSAINAMVWRLKVQRSWVKGRSECPDCGHVLAPKDLIPVFSYVSLGGKCRYCRAPIQDHPSVEVVTAAAFAVSAAVLLTGPVTVSNLVNLVFWLVILVMLIVLAVFDKRWMILPDKVMLPLILVAFAAGLTQAVMERAPELLANYLAAAVVAGGVFYAIVFFSKGKAMGGGDIKLAFAMGLILGLQNTAVAMLIAFNVAAIVGVTMIVTKKRSRKDLIPFGPFLVAATIVAYLFGDRIVDWYLRLNGLI